MSLAILSPSVISIRPCSLELPSHLKAIKKPVILVYRSSGNLALKKGGVTPVTHVKCRHHRSCEESSSSRFNKYEYLFTRCSKSSNNQTKHLIQEFTFQHVWSLPQSPNIPAQPRKSLGRFLRAKPSLAKVRAKNTTNTMKVPKPSAASKLLQGSQPSDPARQGLWWGSYG